MVYFFSHSDDFLDWGSGSTVMLLDTYSFLSTSLYKQCLPHLLPCPRKTLFFQCNRSFIFSRKSSSPSPTHTQTHTHSSSLPLLRNMYTYSSSSPTPGWVPSCGGSPPGLRAHPSLCCVQNNPSFLSAQMFHSPSSLVWNSLKSTH